MPRAWDTCAERSRTRRHFSGAGRVQREGARGQLCAVFYPKLASWLVVLATPQVQGETHLKKSKQTLDRRLSSVCKTVEPSP